MYYILAIVIAALQQYLCMLGMKGVSKRSHTKGDADRNVNVHAKGAEAHSQALREPHHLHC